MHVIIQKHCNKCGQIPPDGFWPSRASRYDWICPKCCINQNNERRRKVALCICPKATCTAELHRKIKPIIEGVPPNVAA